MKNDGGCAFPVTTGIESLADGMTLRDYFAAKALQGWLASYANDTRHPVDADKGAAVAQQSYAMADAMLAERAKAWL